MAEFVAFSPDAEVRGVAILGMLRALGDRAMDLLQRHGLENVQPDGWYPQQLWLNALQDIAAAESNVIFDFIAIAKEIARNIPLPDGIDSVEAVLLRESEVYRANNRHCPGSISAKKVAEGHIEVTVCNPYPHAMMYGIVWGLATRFQPTVMVEYKNEAPCATEDECCVYVVTW